MPPYESFNQSTYSSRDIFPLSHSAFFSLARSPQAYSSSGRIFPDFVQAKPNFAQLEKSPFDVRIFCHELHDYLLIEVSGDA